MADLARTMPFGYAGCMPGPLAAYRAKLDSGELLTDPAQALAAERLQALFIRLRSYDPEHQPAVRKRFWRPGRRDDLPEDYPNGLYLVGDVGRGKTMLMDLFFAAADVPRKRRVHFHAFMQDVYRRMQAQRQTTAGDPIPAVAADIAREAALLCFDEFQITNVADATILGRLFEALFAAGTVVVATSNTRMDDLFAGQPGRDAFLPFIGVLKRHLDMIVMHGSRDWRRQQLRGMPTWHVPANAQADAALDEAFRTLTAGVEPRMERLRVMGHALSIPQAASGVARFDFDALCGQPLGAGDYVALATHYQAVVLDGVPRLSPDNYDVARRFIVLVDALYDHRVKLIASADATPDMLYQRGEGAVAFERTASRLHEMQSRTYLALPHLT